MLKVLAVALLAFGATVSFACAQSKIFIASTGNDANDGSRGSPKRSLQAAPNAVLATGEIVILDTAGYGAVTITKGLGIVVPPGVNGFVTLPNTTSNGIVINTPSKFDVVTLRGLIIEGAGNTGNGFGILAQSVGKLVVEDTIVRSIWTGIGVNSNVDAQLVVRGGAIRDTFHGVAISDNAANVKVDALVTDTEFTGNIVDALSAKQVNSGSTARLVATRCAISGAQTNVMMAVGTGANIVVDGCTIAGNGPVFNANGGVIYSRGNNTLFNNTGPGNFTPIALAAQ